MDHERPRRYRTERDVQAAFAHAVPLVFAAGLICGLLLAVFAHLI